MEEHNGDNHNLLVLSKGLITGMTLHRIIRKQLQLIHLEVSRIETAAIALRKMKKEQTF